jgi:hypothetical protein
LLWGPVSRALGQRRQSGPSAATWANVGAPVAITGPLTDLLFVARFTSRYVLISFPTCRLPVPDHHQLRPWPTRQPGAAQTHGRQT